MKSGFEIAEQRIRECASDGLDLRGLDLTKIPKSIKRWVNLDWLFLANNKIRDISALADLVKLRALDISHNNISDFSELAPLINLKWLYTSCNKTTKLPNALQNRINSGDLYSDVIQKGIKHDKYHKTTR